MFYINDPHGVQKKYTAAEFRALRRRFVQETESTASPTSVEGQEHETPIDPYSQHEQAGTSTPQNNPYHKIDQEIPEREPAIIAEQIMSTAIVALEETETISSAWKLFKARRFRHVPIISKQKVLTGLVSDRNFLSLLIDIIDHNKTVEDVILRDIMTVNLLTATPDTEIRDIAKMMFQERIGAIPIVNTESVFVGLITRSDILRTVVNKEPLTLWV